MQLLGCGVPVVGAVYDRTGGFWWLFALMAALAATIVLAAFFLPADRKRPVLAAAPAPAPAE